jgi:hypothetical protein
VSCFNNTIQPYHDLFHGCICFRYIRESTLAVFIQKYMNSDGDGYDRSTCAWNPKRLLRVLMIKIATIIDDRIIPSTVCTTFSRIIREFYLVIR